MPRARRRRSLQVQPMRQPRVPKLPRRPKRPVPARLPYPK
jgi:hypothetical protein